MRIILKIRREWDRSGNLITRRGENGMEKAFPHTCALNPLPLLLCTAHGRIALRELEQKWLQAFYYISMPVFACLNSRPTEA
jgi:hypothetical protein